MNENVSENTTDFRPPLSGFRIGLGTDIHKLVGGRKLILGGIEIPFDKGLLGHSDADSLSHAITDALLGAAGLGDIGIHFSDQDSHWKNADSSIFLAQTCEMLSEIGWSLVNLDATIMAEQPKLMPHLPAMITRLADVMKIEAWRINLKAKTNEGLDAVGRGEAIAAQAIVLLQPQL